MMLTIEESRMISELNKSQQDRIYGMLEALEDSGVSRDELNKFEIKELEMNRVSFKVSWKSENFLLENKVFVIMKSRGAMEYAEDCNTEIHDKNIKEQYKWDRLKRTLADIDE